MAKPIETAPKRPPRNPPRGYQRIMVRLEPKQIAALMKEAQARMVARGRRQLDASEVVREAVAAWLAGRKRT